MAVRSNTYAIRAGANQFASAADGMRQISNRVQQIAATLSESWQGQAENSFHKVAELLQSDIQTASDAFERAFSALDTLANQLDQANALYQQADQIGSQIQSLEWSLSGADEQSRASLSSEIAQLSYRRSSLENEAQSIEYQANSAATAVFNDIASLVNRLHSYSGLEKSPSNNTSIADKIGHFINNLWNSVDNEFKKIENSLEQDIQEFNDFASEHPAIGTQIGFTEGLFSAGWDAIKASWGLEKILIGADPQGGVDLVKSVFHAVLHPEETYHNLVDDSKVIWSTIGQSFEEEVVHGNAYTASKWTGYAIGEVAQLFIPDGEGEVAAVRLGKEVVQVGKKGVKDAKNIFKSKKAVLGTEDVKETPASEENKAANQLTNAIPSKYATTIDHKVTVIDHVDLPSWLQATFTDEVYRTVVTNEDIDVYRSFGGKAGLKGAFASTTPAGNRIQSKIDSALLPNWKNTRQYEAVIRIPKGTVLNIGKVAPQETVSGTVLLGGGDQLLLPQNWPDDWIQSIREIPSR